MAKHLSTIVALALVLGGCGAPAVPTPVVEPTIRPAPSAAPPSALASDNLAHGKPATASASLPDQPPSAAVDGDPETIWNSGGLPTQWIEIDFGSVFDIERVILLTAQTPDGPTIHQVWGRGDSGDYRLFHEFRGSTADGVTLDVSPASYWSSIRYLKIETTESPSWVAWREIEVFGTPAAAGPVAASGPPEVIFHNGNLLTMEADRPSAQAIAVRGGMIAAVGTDAQVLPLAAANTVVVDLQGRTLTPGFINGHSHHIPQRYKWGFESLDQAVQSALEQGWTGLTELAVDQAELDELIEAAESGRLPVRVNAYLLVKTFEGESLGEWFNAYRPGQTFGTTLRVAGLKVFTDFDNGTVLYWEPAELEAFLRERSEEGWQVTLKSVSTLSLELVLDAVEPILQGGSNTGPRYRIEHALAVNDAQLGRLARMGLIASIQPGIVGVISGQADLDEIVAKEGSRAVARWRDLAEAGVPMVGSPYNPDGVNAEYTSPSHVSPLGVAYRGATQIGLGGRPPEAWMVQHALTVEEILPLLTLDAAFATFEEGERGSLTPGKLADLVLFSDDPLAVPVEDLLGIDVLMTMVGGRVEYCAPEAQAWCPREDSVQPTTPPTALPVGDGQIVLHQPFAVIVAYVGPQTGTGRALFTPLQQAGQKAIEDHGPVHGFGVNLIAFNDFCTEAGGKTAAQQIVADEHIVAVLGPVCSNGVIGALPALQAANVVMISGSATIPGLSVYGPSVFHRSLLDDDQVDILGYPSQIYIEDLPAVQTWLADFAAWGGGLLETGLNHFSPYQYDAMGVLLRALDLSSQALNDGSLLIDREALRAAVRGTTNYPGVTGYITFDAQGNRVP